VEVYDSLFGLFSIVRDLLLELPAREFQIQEGLPSLMLRVQNDGLRPHLTRWQADFRSWWERAKAAEEYAVARPQEIQRNYPRYAELVEDLKTTNTELSKFADQLLTIARPAKRKAQAAPGVSPLPPNPPT